MSDHAAAAQLKNEGNDFFRKQDYVGAIAKYSEALTLDDKNAVLYANRAACNYGLHKYLDAVDDANMATGLDPGYAKAWARLASARDALADWHKSVEAWQKALDALPKTNLSTAEKQQKDQYTASLRAVNARIKAAIQNPVVPLIFNEKDGKFPWQVAAEMLPELRKTATSSNIKNITSSAWVIANAYEEFAQGVEIMKGLKEVPNSKTPNGCVLHGNTEGLTCLTNGVMRDMRVFHINVPNWIAMYNKQVEFEATAHQAWNVEGLETIKQSSQKRLKEKGWDSLRPALSVTVRGWIMRGIFDGNLRNQPQTGVEYLKRALDLLDWGRIVWKDVPKSNRGVIFEDTFVVGVRGMYLKEFMEAYHTDPGLNSKFPLQQLKEEAEGLLKEIAWIIQNPTKDDVDPGFVSSFIPYPAGIAYSMIGFYHVQITKYTDNLMERMFGFMNGATAYLEAAGKYPEDDECHAWFLNCALDLMRNAGVRIDDFNVLANRLREAAPKMKTIWALSTLAKGGRDEKIQSNLNHAAEIMQRVADGKLTLGDPVPLVGS